MTYLEKLKHDKIEKSRLLRSYHNVLKEQYTVTLGFKPRHHLTEAQVPEFVVRI